MDVEHPDQSARSGLRPGFGTVLLLTLGQIVFRLAAPDDEWANVTSVVLQGAIVVSAAVAARAPRLIVRIVWMAVAAVVAASVVTLVRADAEVGPVLPVTVALVVLATGMIVYRSLTHIRQSRAVTLDIMFGVLTIYLLIGVAFSLVFQAIGDLGSGDFFVSSAADSPPNFLYFSFVTMTTVGYGDLVAATAVGRAFAVSLALIGQIYLVTVVAVIVSSLGRGSAAEAESTESPAETSSPAE